jgi:DNA-binding FrmR family transcriptional regulator
MKELYPNHAEQLTRLKRIEGQIRGLQKMVEERRYCIDIATQIKAVKAALTKVELGVMEKHIHHCVADAVASGDPAEIDTKIEEIVRLVGRMS